MLREPDLNELKISKITRRSLLGQSAAVGFFAPLLGTDHGWLRLPAIPDTIELLNFLLRLEHLQANLYETADERFSTNDILRSDFAQQFGDVLQSETPNKIEHAADQEQDHINWFVDEIEQRGGKPVPSCTYDFGFDDPDEFYRVVGQIENIVVSSYLNVIPQFEEQELQSKLQMIHTVEARHASYFNLPAGFPDSFDTPQSTEEVIEKIDQYVSVC